ncbi:uncharacterized protein [Drosophila kikkawai]|uniref:Uncharacterized protein n=1 Tax=Drosophila kikkawai TaxID=30033 RepID=A0A6P4II32_DROKI|nr:uncharacterized protein LOC108075389 [Drosophila kikkawai]
MGVICISQDSDIGLFNNLASTFNHMRNERIILWMQVNATEELMQEVCTMAEKYLFGQIVVLDTVSSGNVSVKVYRLRPFPRPYFVLIDDAFSCGAIFQVEHLNFQGKEAIVLPKREYILRYNISYGPKRSFPINSDEDRHIVEFSLRRNLSLKLYQGNVRGPKIDHFDMQLSPRLVTIRDVTETANSFTIVSLIVLVPCGQERLIQNVFKQLEFEDWLLYVLPVYATFVAVEWLMHYTIYRVTGRVHRLNFLNPLVNLRAFAAILGMSFPLCRRWSFSLHQLFLVLSIFGFVFSNFFACKLSALLTKHPRYAQIQSLEQLRLSGMPVVIDKNLENYLKRDIDRYFLKTILPNTVGLDLRQTYNLLLSLNNSFAYIVFKDSFPILDKYQKSLGPKILCDAENLTILSDLQKMYYLSPNSLYKWPLRQFINRIYESGINLYWKKESIGKMRKALNMSLQSVVKQEAVPLSLEHFNWLWPLLIFGYGTAFLVFLIELLLGFIRDRLEKKSSRVPFSEA